MSLFITTDPVLFPQPQLGIVEEPILPNQPGYIRFQGTYWQAKLHHHEDTSILQSGAMVNVLGRDGLILLVEAR